MADDKPPQPKPPDGKPKFDPFKADDPVLPGMTKKTPAGAAPVAPGSAAFKLDFKDPKILAGAGGVGLVLIVLIVWMFSGSSQSTPPATPPAQPEAAAPTPAATAPASPTASAPPFVQVPGPAGTVDEFPQAWSVKKIFVRSATGRVPAMIIRLPGGSARNASSYWGLLLMSPYGRCELEYLTDLKKIADDYGHRSSHPMVVDPCNLTVFDPTRLGDVGGIVARGAVVQGTTLRPPLGMELKIEGNRILILQTE